MVIDVVVGVRVIFDGLMHANELVVEVRLVSNLVLYAVYVNMEPPINLEVGILVVALVPSILLRSAAQTSLLSVFVNSPKIVDSVVNSLVVRVAGNHCWSQSPEKYVLSSQLKHCYKDEMVSLTRPES
jgi:hypothetical protein